MSGVGPVHGLTPIVLLFLVIVPKLPLPLGSHTTLGLHHLVGFVRSTLMPLVGVEVLEVGARVGMHGFAVANRVSMLGHTTHTGAFRSGVSNVFVRKKTVIPCSE